jgi:hypothetical protein
LNYSFPILFISGEKALAKNELFWMAEPGHPHEAGVPHTRPPAAGTHEAPAKKGKYSRNRIFPSVSDQKGGFSIISFPGFSTLKEGVAGGEGVCRRRFLHLSSNNIEYLL